MKIKTIRYMSKNFKKSIVLIGLGVINILHASMHIIHFIQSMILVRYTMVKDNTDETIIDSLSHNPYFAILWAIVGIFTLWIGIKDFKHHKKCSHKK